MNQSCPIINDVRAEWGVFRECEGTELNVPWPTGDDTSLTKRKRGFDSLRGDSIKNGLVVQRNDAWPATRKSGFDSPVVHCFGH
jgi:hypothetical protein